MATEKERTPMEKLKGIAMELVTLKARLPEPYRSNVETCIGWCHDLEEHLTIIDTEDEQDSKNEDD